MRLAVEFPLILLAACGSPRDTMRAGAPEPLPFFGEGYRYAGDPCRRLGESDATRNWLDDAADLIGCPEGPEARAFAATSGARMFDVIGDTLLLSVPRR